MYLVSFLFPQLDTYKRDVETDRAKAMQICEPIATQRLPDDLESEINQIQRRVIEEEKEQGNEQEITDKFKQKKDTYERIKREVRQLYNFLEKLEEVKVFVLFLVKNFCRYTCA